MGCCRGLQKVLKISPVTGEIIDIKVKYILKFSQKLWSASEVSIYIAVGHHVNEHHWVSNLFKAECQLKVSVVTSMQVLNDHLMRNKAKKERERERERERESARERERERER